MQGKINLLFFVWPFICCLNLPELFGDDSVKLQNVSKHTLSVFSTPHTYDVYTEEPGGDPSDEDNPLVAYIPIAGPSSVEQYFYLRKNLVDTSILATPTSHAVVFPLLLNVGLTEKFLTVAVKNGANYIVSTNSTDGNFSNLTNSNYSFSVSPGDFCAVFTTNPCSTTVAVQPEILIYVFWSDAVLSKDDTIADISQYPNGVYFKLKMSNKIPSTSTQPVINKVIVGDTRLILEFSSVAKMADGKDVRVFEHTPASIGDRAIGDPAVFGDLRVRTIDYVQSGEFNVSDLQNNNDYLLSVLFVNKYGLASKLSVIGEGRPLEIAELLKKQACFLLTAGFGEEHFIIDYFRHFRDEILSQYSLGQKFIDKYYEMAPKYALIIYQSEILRFFVRAVAYGLYFLMKYFALILTSGIVLSSVYFFLKIKRKKITV